MSNIVRLLPGEGTAEAVCVEELPETWWTQADSLAVVMGGEKMSGDVQLKVVG